MNETDGLPTLVLTKIFSFLTIHEKLRAKQVCKLWKFVVEQIVQQRLCLYASRLPRPSHIRWHEGSNEPMNDQDKLWVINEMQYEERTTRYLLNVANALRLRLRKIYLYNLSFCSRFLKQIEKFKRLDELAIESTFKVILDKLISPSLRTISFKAVDNFSGSPLQLETPNLTRFIFWNWSSISEGSQTF